MPLRVHIEPYDTVFFRDNRPFDAGHDIIADSVLPSPLTLFGIIGSYYLDGKNILLQEFITNGNDRLGEYDPSLTNAKLKIKGPFFKYYNEIYFPPPANLWASGNDTQSYFLRPGNSNNFLSDIKSETLRTLEFPAEAYEPAPLVKQISLQGVNHYLSANIDNELLSDYVRAEEDFFVTEDRYGHGLDAGTNTVEEGLLYSAKHIRLRDERYNPSMKTVFSASVDGLDISDISDGTTTVGGEGKIVKIWFEEDSQKIVPDSPEVLKKIKDSKRFLLYLITPAIFSDGWSRKWSSHDIVGADFERAVFIGAAVNKPVYISGWQKCGQSAGGSPRVLMKTAPAGSVYFFEAQDWDDTRFRYFYEKYHCGESLSDYYPCAGFGTALIGSW